MLYDYLTVLDGLPDAARRCPVCGGTEIETDHDVFQLRAVGADGAADFPSGPIQLCALIHCGTCDFIRLHAVRLGN